MIGVHEMVHSGLMYPDQENQAQTKIISVLMICELKSQNDHAHWVRRGAVAGAG
jgi:hypothetical protein